MADETRIVAEQRRVQAKMDRISVRERKVIEAAETLHAIQKSPQICDVAAALSHVGEAVDALWEARK